MSFTRIWSLTCRSLMLPRPEECLAWQLDVDVNKTLNGIVWVSLILGVELSLKTFFWRENFFMLTPYQNRRCVPLGFYFALKSKCTVEHHMPLTLLIE